MTDKEFQLDDIGMATIINADVGITITSSGNYSFPDESLKDCKEGIRIIANNVDLKLPDIEGGDISVAVRIPTNPDIAALHQDLEVAHQANNEISKHNQELSKENEILKREVKQAYERGRQDMDELWKVDDD